MTKLHARYMPALIYGFCFTAILFYQRNAAKAGRLRAIGLAYVIRSGTSSSQNPATPPIAMQPQPHSAQGRRIL